MGQLWPGRDRKPVMKASLFWVQADSLSGILQAPQSVLRKIKLQLLVAVTAKKLTLGLTFLTSLFHFYWSSIPILGIAFQSSLPVHSPSLMLFGKPDWDIFQNQTPDPRSKTCFSFILLHLRLWKPFFPGPLIKNLDVTHSLIHFISKPCNIYP